uniref:Cadherin domain-containing protein n=1 Tax=Soboliphyme baturini TaxID=241478 RepID=A0A183J7H0_9BILA
LFSCYINNQKVQLPEDAPPWSLVLCVSAFDLDLGAAGLLAYDFDAPENIYRKFAIDSESGCILLKQRLKDDEQHMYNFTVRVSDHGNPPLTTRCHASLELLKVRTNRYPPVFDNIAVEASVFENEPQGTSVAKVLAKDADAGPHEIITYSLTGGDGAAFFVIDYMGEIRTKKMLNREKKAYYWLEVEATDSDRNDNAPIPTEPVFHGSVKENCAAGTSVLVVSADDLDSPSGPLNYTIKSGNTQSLFDINPTTGNFRFC